MCLGNLHGFAMFFGSKQMQPHLKSATGGALFFPFYSLYIALLVR
jgi:hypothetical protein